jgi:polyprenyl-phospho-N-acetylgalactosaminyl synthase
MSGVTVVIPAYNESTVVREVIERVSRVCPSVVVVDDGSSDATGEQARLAGALVVRHAINLGQGAALQTGILCALKRGAEFVVTFDADGQHDPADIVPLVDALRRGNADVALGSRFAGTAVDMPKSRRLMLHAARCVNFVLTGLMLSDAHNGVRAFTRAAAARIRIQQAGMAHATEIVAQIARHKLAYVEVPVTVHYTPYSLEKGQRLSNSFHILMDLFLSGLQR